MPLAHKHQDIKHAL